MMAQKGEFGGWYRGIKVGFEFSRTYCGGVGIRSDLRLASGLMAQVRIMLLSQENTLPGATE